MKLILTLSFVFGSLALMANSKYSSGVDDILRVFELILDSNSMKVTHQQDVKYGGVTVTESVFEFEYKNNIVMLIYSPAVRPYKLNTVEVIDPGGVLDLSATYLKFNSQVLNRRAQITLKSDNALYFSKRGRNTLERLVTIQVAAAANLKSTGHYDKDRSAVENYINGLQERISEDYDSRLYIPYQSYDSLFDIPPYISASSLYEWERMMPSYIKNWREPFEISVFGLFKSIDPTQIKELFIKSDRYRRANQCIDLLSLSHKNSL